MGEIFLRISKLYKAILDVFPVFFINTIRNLSKKPALHRGRLFLLRNGL